MVGCAASRGSPVLTTPVLSTAPFYWNEVMDDLQCRFYIRCSYLYLLHWMWSNHIYWVRCNKRNCEKKTILQASLKAIFPILIRTVTCVRSSIVKEFESKSENIFNADYSVFEVEVCFVFGVTGRLLHLFFPPATFVTFQIEGTLWYTIIFRSHWMSDWIELNWIDLKSLKALSFTFTITFAQMIYWTTFSEKIAC